jgi:hypothetical protein
MTRTLQRISIERVANLLKRTAPIPHAVAVGG